MKKSIIIVLSLALCLAFSSCERQPRLVILHTNDTHSHIEPLRTGEFKGICGVIERGAFVDSVRAKYGFDKVLLLDAGDFSQGTSYFSELGGTLEPKLLNDLAYDCVAIGNHEFDNGIEDLAGRLATLKDTKVVCANYDFSQFKTLSAVVKPYTILQRGGMKIGIIGMEAYLASVVSATIASRLPKLDDVEVVNRWSKLLKEEERCDFIILLSHLGYSEDQKLVPQVHYLDLVIGGHSHTFVDDFLYVDDADGKSVPIITDGCWGEQVGEIKLY